MFYCKKRKSLFLSYKSSDRVIYLLYLSKLERLINLIFSHFELFNEFLISVFEEYLGRRIFLYRFQQRNLFQFEIMPFNPRKEEKVSPIQLSLLYKQANQNQFSGKSNQKFIKKSELVRS